MTCEKRDGYELHTCCSISNCTICRDDNHLFKCSIIQEIDIYSNSAVDLLKQLEYTQIDEKTWLSRSGNTKVNVK